MSDQIYHLEAVPNTVSRDGFSYGIRFSALAPGQTQNGTLTIQADADFLIHNQTQFTSVLGAAQTNGTRIVPLVNVMLVDSGSGRQLFNQAVPVDTVFGSAQLPYILPSPKYLFARSTLQVQVTNLSGTITYTDLFLTFNGEKIYNKSDNN